jgi:hypothetical protein
MRVPLSCPLSPPPAAAASRTSLLTALAAALADVQGMRALLHGFGAVSEVDCGCCSTKDEPTPSSRVALAAEALASLEGGLAAVGAAAAAAPPVATRATTRTVRRARCSQQLQQQQQQQRRRQRLAPAPADKGAAATSAVMTSVVLLERIVGFLSCGAGRWLYLAPVSRCAPINTNEFNYCAQHVTLHGAVSASAVFSSDMWPPPPPLHCCLLTRQEFLRRLPGQRGRGRSGHCARLDQHQRRDGVALHRQVRHHHISSARQRHMP